MQYIIKNHHLIIIAILSAILFTNCQKHCNHIELPEMYTSDMIIQQNARVTFFGKANPGSQITITTDWDFSVSSTTRPDSTWRMILPTPQASLVPHTITISTTDTSIVLKDVLIGEVWLAAGQSNMEMPLKGWPTDSIENSAFEIEHSYNANIRIFEVRQTVSFEEEKMPKGKWLRCTPKNIADISAAAYFFAKKIHHELNIPIGIVCANNGGTPCESWIPAKDLSQLPYFKTIIEDIKKAKPEIKLYNNWLNTLPAIEHIDKQSFGNINIYDEYVVSGKANISQWENIQLPKFIEKDSRIGELDGVIWFVKQIELPDDWIGQSLTLNLGTIDDCDETYFNGEKIGHHSYGGCYNVTRSYQVPSRLTNNTTATIAVRLTDTKGDGGFGSSEKIMKIFKTKSPQKAISLSGQWKFRVAAEFFQNKLVLFDIKENQFAKTKRPQYSVSNTSPSLIYNGMINPILNYSYAGVIWYQGENNVGKANEYAQLLPILVKSWRDRLNYEVPFFYAQIAPWSYFEDPDGTSGANLRGAQYLALEHIKNSGIISTLDIGDSLTMHPCNKRVVGERFAQMALNKIYGRSDVACGPMPRMNDMKIVGKIVGIKFDNADGLYISDTKKNLFEIAGADSIFFNATASVDSNGVILFSHAVPNPKFIRYAFKNYTKATLYNIQGIPAPTFCNSLTKD